MCAVITTMHPKQNCSSVGNCHDVTTMQSADLTCSCMCAAVVDAARMIELLVACEASRSQAEGEARSAAAAMHLAASHTKYERRHAACHNLRSEHAF